MVILRKASSGHKLRTWARLYNRSVFRGALPNLVRLDHSGLLVVLDWCVALHQLLQALLTVEGLVRLAIHLELSFELVVSF